MNICKSFYYIKFMSGEIIPITFSYLLDFDMKNFKISFVSELRKKFKDKDIYFDQIKLFHSENNEDIYNFDYIPENNYIFDIFINDDKNILTEEEIEYYQNVWKGEENKSYLIWCKKYDEISLFSILYCGVEKNYITISAFNDKEFKNYIKKSYEYNEELEFLDDMSYLRYVYETGQTSLY